MSVELAAQAAVALAARLQERQEGPTPVQAAVEVGKITLEALAAQVSLFYV